MTDDRCGLITQIILLRGIVARATMTEQLTNEEKQHIHLIEASGHLEFWQNEPDLYATE